MKQKEHFYRLARLIIISILHVVLSVVFVITSEFAFIHIFAIVLIVTNILFLLRFFTTTVQLVLASRLEKKQVPMRYYTLFNVLLGVILNAAIIFVLFVIMFNHIDQIV